MKSKSLHWIEIGGVIAAGAAAAWYLLRGQTPATNTSSATATLPSGSVYGANPASGALGGYLGAGGASGLPPINLGNTTISLGGIGNTAPSYGNGGACGCGCGSDSTPANYVLTSPPPTYAPPDLPVDNALLQTFSVPATQQAPQFAVPTPMPMIG